MANVMSMRNIRNKPSRDGFDLSRRNLFTAKVGELLPVWQTECLPGDKFKISLSDFVRTQPVNTAAFTRIRSYYDFYFVPYRLLWRYSESFFFNMDYGQSAISSTPLSEFINEGHPMILGSQLREYLDVLRGADGGARPWGPNILGYDRYPLTLKLLEYLGYGDWSVTGAKADRPLNLFPLAAYQKIYCDYFRDSQWERSQPETFNFDYMGNSITKSPVFPMSSYLQLFKGSESTYGVPNIFDIRYANWNKDYFMGLLPEPQYGPEAVASPLTGSSRMTFTQVNPVGDDMKNGFIATASGGTDGTLGLSVVALRMAQSKQKYKEITLSGNKDYRSQMQKHWDVDPGIVRSGLCEYLGGTSSNININEVINTNLSDSSYDADIAGKGAGAGHGSISYDVKEHGIMMCIYHAVPLLEYEDGIEKICQKYQYTDYAIPEFDKVGMQPVHWTSLLPVGSPISDNVSQFLGYGPRYLEYKTSYDVVHGEFRKSLRHWVAPLSSEYLLRLSIKQLELTGQLYGYISRKVSPSVVGSIFAVEPNSEMSTDHLLCCASFDVKAVRNLDYDGLPY